MFDIGDKVRLGGLEGVIVGWRFDEGDIWTVNFFAPLGWRGGRSYYCISCECSTNKLLKESSNECGVTFGNIDKSIKEINVERLRKEMKRLFG